MSDFSDRVEDYFEFDEEDIEEQFGSDAMEAVRDFFQGVLDDIMSLFDFAESEEEGDFAIEQVDDFRVTLGEALNIASDYELEYLTEYMSQSYKDNQDLIDRYKSLTGQG